MPDAQDTIAQEFGCYYHVDELPVVTSERFDVPERAAESAERIRDALRDTSEAAALLRAAADDPSHPLIPLIANETVLEWRDDKNTWSVLQHLLRRIADELDR